MDEDYNPGIDPEQDPNNQGEPYDDANDQQPAEEDVDQYFDDGGETFLPADHVLMVRLQNALTKQLTDEHERVDLQLREKEEEVRKVRKSREDTGVQLYGVQHQLAKMQTTFERTHDNYNIVQRYRVEAERQHEVLQRQYESKKEEADEQLKRVLKAQDELNQLNRTLKQVEEYNEVMKSELALTRRTTYRAEENVGNLEKVKKKQDLLINSMNEEIKRLNEQKTLYQAQLISQKEETAAARNTLKEAAIEIERIVMSKKTLLEDWQKSLLLMQERDKALAAIKELISQKNDEIILIKSQINGVVNETNKEQDFSERLNQKLEKAKYEHQQLEAKKEEIEAAQKRLQEQYNMLKASLQQTETETQRMDTEKASVDEKMTILEKSIMNLHKKTTDIRTEIINQASQQKTIEKSSANMLKQTKNIYEHISKKEIEIEDTSNEISRVKIDNLNTQSQNELLQKKLNELIGELKENEKKVQLEERSIKERHTEIAAKQLRVDRLNKQLEENKAQHGSGDENKGPLENEKAAIVKSIEELDEEITQAQKSWIANQKSLIQQQNTQEKLTGANDELRNKKTILEQKKMRLNNAVDSHNKEIKQLEVALKNMVFEMNKLNDLFYTNKRNESILTNESQNIEYEFKQKLKELENRSIKLEEQISQKKEEKSDILQEIVKAERQILLWERKYTLEKEMQDALDPTIGQTEIVLMRKEIHRMQLRYDQLKKRQEEMIKDMERAIFKRETIQLKYLPKVEKKNAEDRSSQGKLSRQVANLKQTLKHTTDNQMQLETTMEQRKREITNIQSDINQEREDNDQVRNELKTSQLDLLTRRLETSQQGFTHAKLALLAKRFGDVATQRFASQVPEEQAQQVLEQEAQRNAAVEAVIKRLQAEDPNLDRMLKPLVEW